MWHGSTRFGERSDNNCKDWSSGRPRSFGAASPLVEMRLLGQKKMSCDRGLIVLCIEGTSSLPKRRRKRSVEELLENNNDLVNGQNNPKEVKLNTNNSSKRIDQKLYQNKSDKNESPHIIVNKEQASDSVETLNSTLLDVNETQSDSSNYKELTEIRNEEDDSEEIKANKNAGIQENSNLDDKTEINSEGILDEAHKEKLYRSENLLKEENLPIHDPLLRD